MAENKQNIRFIRKGGRIIPIRVKGQRGQQNKKQRAGKTLLKIGAGVSLFGVAQRKFGLAQGKGSTNIFKKVFKRRKDDAFSRLQSSMSAKRNIKKGVIKIGVGLGVVAAGTALTFFGTKQVARENRELATKLEKSKSGGM